MSGLLGETPKIRRLTAADGPEFRALRREALLAHPLVFGSAPQDDRFRKAEALSAYLERGEAAILLGAFDPALVGCVGVYQDAHVKATHKVHIWGFYLRPEHRRRGLGRALMMAALDHARTLPGAALARLSVSEAAPEARALYEQLGFEAWGREPDALRWGDAVAAELHMSLPL